MVNTSDANAQYHLLKLLVNLGVISNFILLDGRFRAIRRPRHPYEVADMETT